MRIVSRSLVVALGLVLRADARLPRALEKLLMRADWHVEFVGSRAGCAIGAIDHLTERERWPGVGVLVSFSSTTRASSRIVSFAAPEEWYTPSST